MTTQGTAAGLVDWRTVERLTALIPAGPSASRSARASSVAVLRRSAQEAPAWVARITGLNRAAQQVAETTRVSVVDRAGLVRASTRALRGLMEQVPAPQASEAVRLVGAAEMAGAMSLLATRLLGQVVPAAGTGVDDAAVEAEHVGQQQLGVHTRRVDAHRGQAGGGVAQQRGPGRCAHASPPSAASRRSSSRARQEAITASRSPSRTASRLCAL